MERYPQLVFLIGPDLSSLDHPQLSAQVPDSEKYRLIRCQTIAGVTHVLKHVRPSLAILPVETPATVEKDIASFVGEVRSLQSDEETNEIFESLLS